MAIFLISLFAAIILEGTITTLPLVLLIILFLAVVNRTNDVFIIAFFSGLLLDMLTLGRIGFSSLYFTVFVFLIFLYQRKFEIETLHFVAIFSFVGSFIYLFLEGDRFVFFQSVFSTFLIVLSFLTYKRFNKKVRSYGS
jgi:rod shape-determining protein MreD